MSLYEIFFELEISLIERFPSLTPFTVRQTKATEVFLLIRRLNNYTEYKDKDYKIKNNKPVKVIRRPAGDDWF